ncbi:LysE family translocator [Sphaerisporangium perillae]|uniref:LysE family translocator n=1 Tax=Sphaerisporangium perillae TaxID=2935860 RepID=UPI00200E2DD1|nr:LysE family translocator [Sphaerisporangium perillae]
MTIVPGLDTALVLRAAVSGGRRHAVATALGVNTGVLVWGAGAAVGVSALLTASHAAYTLLRYAGAAYMVGTGVLMVWRARRGRGGYEDGDGRQAGGPARAQGGVGRAWLRGVVTNLLNPKIGVFYVALLPQFIPQDVPHLPAGLLLALVHNLEGMVWFGMLIAGTELARGVLGRAGVRRAMDRLTGAVLVAFGLRLALAAD